MKFSIKTLLLFLAVVAIGTTACKDDNEETAADKLTATSCWKQTKSETLDPTTNMWADSAIDDCDKDDCVNYRSDGTLTFDEGATKCDPADPQSSEGTWTLSADGTTLTVTEAATMASFDFTVAELSSSKLVLEIELFGFKNRTTFEPN